MVTKKKLLIKNKNIFFLDEPIYIGAVPWTPIDKNKINKNLLLNTNKLNKNLTENNKKKLNIQFPSTVWSAHLRIGFIGCLKNLRINGINAQIAHVFEEELLQKNLLFKNKTLITPIMHSVKKGYIYIFFFI